MDASETSSFQVSDIEIDRGVPSCPAAEYKTFSADTLKVWQFCAIFLHETNLSIFPHPKLCRDTDIGARARPFLRRSCYGTLQDVLGFDMPIVSQVDEV